VQIDYPQIQQKHPKNPLISNNRMLHINGRPLIQIGLMKNQLKFWASI